MWKQRIDTNLHVYQVSTVQETQPKEDVYSPCRISKDLPYKITRSENIYLGNRNMIGYRYIHVDRLRSALPCLFTHIIGWNTDTNSPTHRETTVSGTNLTTFVQQKRLIKLIYQY
eukprot:398400_1